MKILYALFGLMVVLTVSGCVTYEHEGYIPYNYYGYDDNPVTHEQPRISPFTRSYYEEKVWQAGSQRYR